MREHLTILRAGGPRTSHNLAAGFIEEPLTGVLSELSREGKTVWVDVYGEPSKEVIASMQTVIGVHHLSVEDIMHGNQRSKHETYDKYDFVTLRDVRVGADRSVHNEQISIVFSDKYVFSFHKHVSAAVDSVIRRTEADGCKAATKAADYLAYCIIDAVVDDYFSAIDTLEEVADGADEMVSSLEGDMDHNVLKDIHWLRRTAIALRKSIRPMRDVCNSMSSSESRFITPGLSIYVRDLYDHTTRVVESIDTLRDAAYSMSEMHMSNNSMKMNGTMKVLTIITTVFTPVMFLASIYGMNFDWIPEIHIKGGYYAFWCVAVCLTGAQLYYFRRKRWI